MTGPNPPDIQDLQREYRRKHPKPTPPPAPKPSWTLTNGPWVFVESDPATCRPGPWTRLDVHENVYGDTGIWTCKDGWVPQAEGGETDGCLAWIDATKPVGSIAPVTTLGIDVKPYLARGVTSCLVECYLQGQPNALEKYGEALREGWPDVVPVVGCGWAGDNGTYTLADYLPWLRQFGRRFAVYASDPMSDADWATLAGL